MPQGAWQPVMLTRGHGAALWGEEGRLDTVLSVLTGLTASFSGVISSHMCN